MKQKKVRLARVAPASCRVSMIPARCRRYCANEILIPRLRLGMVPGRLCLRLPHDPSRTRTSPFLARETQIDVPTSVKHSRRQVFFWGLGATLSRSHPNWRVSWHFLGRSVPPSPLSLMRSPPGHRLIPRLSSIGGHQYSESPS